MLSTTLQLKISKMKKRLSSDERRFLFVTICFGLSWIVLFVAKPINLIRPYSQIDLKIPIVHIESSVPYANQMPPLTQFSEINKHSVMLIITKNELFFGTVQSFSEDFYQIRNKFRIAHADGRPLIHTCLQQIESWLTSEKRTLSENGRTLIIAPDKELPVPVLMKIVSIIKTRSSFSSVVLATTIS